MTAILQITDGTTTIDLIKDSTEYGFHLASWRPAIPFYKGGGTFQESSLSWGRQLVDKQFENHIDTFSLKANQTDQDALIRELQDIRRLLEKASSYWTTDWQNEPVWLVAKASEEENTRYAQIVLGRIPEDENPYNQPFLQPLCYSAMDNLTLVIEHLAWTDTAPGLDTCVPIAGYGEYCPLCSVEFDGADTIITIPDNAAIQDLHDGAMTVEAWVKLTSWGEANARIIDKRQAVAGSGWMFWISSTTGVSARIECAVTAGESSSGLDDFTLDGEWHHIAYTWDDSSYNYPRLWIDGEEVSYSSTQNRNGAIGTDVGNVLTIGDRTIGGSCLDGLIGWIRVSDAVRYAATFTPPAQCRLPEIDANTVGQWIGAECSGTTITDQGTNSLDGTLADGDFECDCEVVYGNVVSCGPSYLEFTTDLDTVIITDDASFQDLHDGAFTAECWARLYSAGAEGGSFGGIVMKSNAAFSSGWRFVTTSTQGLVATISCATTEGSAQSTLTAFPFDGEWHHIAMTWDDASYNYPRIWIDGVEHTTSISSRNGAIVTDVGFNGTIGNRPGTPPSAGCDGDIGWVRISDTVRYTTTFTPPAQCTLPDVDANTVILECYEGQGITTYDLSGNENDGAISLATWGCDCLSAEEDSEGNPLEVGDIDYGCELPSFLSNHSVKGNITHIFVDDGGVYSANYRGLSVHPLLPSIPAAGDNVYFGICTDLPDGGCPFSSLVFDIGIGAEQLTVKTWQYWSGAGWSTLTLSINDETTGLSRLGPGVVTWDNPTNWVANTINGVTAYWVRFNVSVVGGSPKGAIQNGYPVYTVSWNWTEIESTGVLGDIAALAKLSYETIGNDSEYNRAIISTRSYDRGGLFFSHLHYSDEQKPDDYSVSLSAGSSFATDSQTSTGRCVNAVLGSATTAQSTLMGIGSAISNTSQDFIGKYRVLVIGKSTNGDEDFVTVQFRLVSLVFNTKTGHFTGTNKFEVLDLGLVEIPGFYGSTVNINIATYVGTTNAGGTTINLFELILVPVDEYVVEAYPPDEDSGNVSDGNDLVIDSIMEPKRRILCTNQLSGDVFFVYVSKGQYAGLQANEKQRVYFFCFANSSTPPEWIHEHWACVKPSIYKKQRYLSLRGNR